MYDPLYLSNLDEANENKTEKLSLILKLPYLVKDEIKMKNRLNDIKSQLTPNSYEVVCIGAEENVIQKGLKY